MILVVCGKPHMCHVPDSFPSIRGCCRLHLTLKPHVQQWIMAAMSLWIWLSSVRSFCSTFLWKAKGMIRLDMRPPASFPAQQ